MRKTIKVLHIASFTGNIGDNANHIGSKYLREEYTDFEFNITEKEIREFYWGEWKFNSVEFIETVNQYDLIMIGGGNYFELWVDNSQTGTSIDFSIESLKKTNTPILFYALGCDLGQGASDENIFKFEKFLNYLTNDNRYYVCLRNDGSMENLRYLFNFKYDGKINEIPDGGFFTYIEKDITHDEIELDKINIIINIAGDMPDVRFSNGEETISLDTFYSEFAKMIDELFVIYDDKLNIIFVPHIFRDLQAIYSIINETNDKNRRKYIKVAPYLVGKKGHDNIFSLYKQSQLILGMRFHSNVCGYAFNKNVIGLSNYSQILNLYKNISSNEYVEVNKVGFRTELLNIIIEHLLHSDKYIDFSLKTVNILEEKAKIEYVKLNNWLNLNFGGLQNE